MPIPIIIMAGAAVVTIGATVAKHIFDDQRRDIEDEMRQKAAEQEAFRHKKREERDAYIAALVKERKNQTKARIEELRTVVSEIERVKEVLWKQVYESQITAARRDALFNLLNHITVKGYALTGQVQLLNDYLVQLDQNVKTPPAPMPTGLPDDYIYHGKLFLLERNRVLAYAHSNFSQKQEKLRKLLPAAQPGISNVNDYGQKMYISDLGSLLISDVMGMKNIPVLATNSNSKGSSKTFQLSVGAGILRHNHFDIANPVEVTVTKVRDTFCDVMAYGIKMRLHREDQENPKRRLITGAKTTVYSLIYSPDGLPFRIPGRSAQDYTRFLITENEEKSLNERQFSAIPLWVEHEDFEKVLERLTPFENSSERWTVSPYSEIDPEAKEDVAVERVVLQMANPELAMVARFNIEHEGETVGLHLRFDRFLDARKEPIVFAAFAATIIPQPVGGDASPKAEESKAAFAICEEIRVFLQLEFYRQRMTLKENTGGHYFHVWSNIMRHQISLDSWSRSYCPVMLDDVYEAPDGTWVLDLQAGTIDKLSRWMKNVDDGDDIQTSYGLFVEDSLMGHLDNENNQTLNGCLSLIPLKELALQRTDFIGSVTLKKRENPAASQRQLNALQQFRMGNIENETLKDYLLNREDFSSAGDFEEASIRPMNKLLAKDALQKEILRKMVAVPDLFVLQGPPGTGKTTLIVELIRQELKENPEAKVLVSSQSNTAVDNVLEGLLPTLGGEKVLRAASTRVLEGKEIQACTLDRLHQDYRTQLEKKGPDSREDDVLFTWWRD